MGFGYGYHAVYELALLEGAPAPSLLAVIKFCLSGSSRIARLARSNHDDFLLRHNVEVDAFLRDKITAPCGGVVGIVYMWPVNKHGLHSLRVWRVFNNETHGT